MRKRKVYNELQLELDFRDNASVPDSSSEGCYPLVTSQVKWLPILPEGEKLDIFAKVDTLLRQVIECRMIGASRLGKFILCSFFVEGKSVNDITRLLSEGVEGVPSITRERVRMIVMAIRDEFLSVPSARKLTKGIFLRHDFVKEMAEYAHSHTGHVVKQGSLVSSPRLVPIAFLLRMKVVSGDGVIPWIRTEKILIDEKIEKSVFNAHYASLFFLLQKEVRPMAYEDILRCIQAQRKMQGVEVCEDLLSVLLQHDEVFENVSDGVFQLRAEHLNITQRIARIIYEEKDITPSELKRMYEARYGEAFSSLAAVSRHYPWCVPVGKSKWVYREDGMRLQMPADIIRDFCRKRVQFTWQEILEYLERLGLNIKESSVRCYIVRDCRALNADSNTFCLSSDIPESEDHLWRSKYKTTTRSSKREWKEMMEREIRHVLETAPMHMMLQREVVNQCKHIFAHEGISLNNFYKVASSLPWLKSTSIDGKTYLELRDE